MSSAKPKLLFLGVDSSPISVACLKAILAEDQYEVLIGVDCRDKSFGQRLRQAATHYGWLKLGVRIFGMLFEKVKRKFLPKVTNWRDATTLIEAAQLSQTELFGCVRVNGNAMRKRVRSFEPDLIVMASFPQIVRSRFRSLAKMGVLNFHPSLLPKYRGPTPTYWVLKNRESVSGVTVHFVDDGIDTGDIIAQIEVPLLPHDSASSLTARSLMVGAPLMVVAIDAVLSGTASAIQQDESAASYYGFPSEGKRL